MWKKRNWKKTATDERVLWDGVLIYLFIYSHSAAIDVFFFLPAPEFAFPWCMMDGQRSGCCSNWHIWSLWLIFYWPSQPSFAEEFCCLLNGSCESYLSPFFLSATLTVNSLGTFIDLHEKCMTDTSWFRCRTRFFQIFLNIFFPDRAVTFCCMIDQGLFWHLWKLIVKKEKKRKIATVLIG